MATAPTLPTLHREINALGGVPANDYDRGHNDAIGAVLAILERRGFTEANDAAAPVTYRGYVIRPNHGLGQPYSWQHKDFDGHKWRYHFTSFDDLGEFDVIWRPNDAQVEAA